MTHYRLRLFGLIHGRWWPTREQAEDSAIAKGVARRDRTSGMVYLSPGLAIEEGGVVSDDLAPVAAQA